MLGNDIAVNENRNEQAIGFGATILDFWHFGTRAEKSRFRRPKMGAASSCLDMFDSAFCRASFMREGFQHVRVLAFLKKSFSRRITCGDKRQAFLDAVVDSAPGSDGFAPLRMAIGHFRQKGPTGGGIIADLGGGFYACFWSLASTHCTCCKPGTKKSPRRRSFAAALEVTKSGKR
jgi:hypothetical protein